MDGSKIIKIIKKNSIYQYFRLKYHNYFSAYGVLRNKRSQIFARFDPAIKWSLRKKTAEKMQLSPTEKIISDSLFRSGHAYSKFDEVGVQAKKALELCELKMQECLKNINNKQYLEQFDTSDYSGKIISYELMSDDIEKALSHLALDPKVIRIASSYLECLPLIEDISFSYNPIHGPNEFGSQLWHRDTHHKKILKLFFSPAEITMGGGPFQLFEPKFSSFKYLRSYPDGMTDEELKKTGADFNKIKSVLTKPGDVFFVDPQRCMHRGGLTLDKPRFIGVISFVSPLYSFTYKKYRQTQTFDTTFNRLGQVNDRLIEQFG